MLLSLSWLREFVPYEGSAEALADRLTMLGLELEEIVLPFANIDSIVVGKVVECVPHPNSDHMHICKVDAGQGELANIVCGAPNVAAGQTVAVALLGTTMPDGTVIKKAKLRGEPSFGMICSERELGLSDDHDGILVLPDTYKAGDRLVDVLNLEKDVLDIDITPNRGDCLSVIGLAREVALAYNLPMTIPDRPLVLSHVDAPHPAIEISDPELCYGYFGRVITGIKVAKSPSALRYRLTACGIRPISNVVDVTNYILMECGQPLHSFDLARIRGGRVIVAPAKEGEHFTTLDGKERVLKADDLTIRDNDGVVALAGVMGGLDSEITEASAGVFLESAVFRPATIRRTSRRLGLSSEASFRFERGIDQGRSRWSLDRACAMIQQLAGGEVSDRLCENEPRPFVPVQVEFRPARCAALLGVDPGSDFERHVLTGLGCEVKGDGATWTVPQPSWRPDLTREADLIEEVARYYGMDRVEPVLPLISRSLEDVLRPESQYAFWDRIKRWGAGIGLNEAINYSFVGQKDLDAFGLSKEDRIAMMNPLSEDLNVMRPTIAPGLMVALKNNLAQGASSVRLFELANVFHYDSSSSTTAREVGMMGIIMSGSRYEGGWPREEAELDYLDLKGVVEDFMRFLHLDGFAVRQLEKHAYFTPAVEISAAGHALGVMGRIRPDLADRYNARGAVWMAEFNMDEVRAAYDGAGIHFKPLDIYPPVRRDITVSAPECMKVAEIIDAITAMKRPLLKEVALQDVFVPKMGDTRNLTFRLTFRHENRTLRDAEVDKERDKIAAGLVKALGVKI